MDQPHPHATITQPEGLWDARDVAELLKVSRSWVYHQAEAGHLPSVKLGGALRFVPSDVRTFVSSRSNGNSNVLPVAPRQR